MRDRSYVPVLVSDVLSTMERTSVPKKLMGTFRLMGQACIWHLAKATALNAALMDLLAFNAPPTICFLIINVSDAQIKSRDAEFALILRKLTAINVRFDIIWTITHVKVVWQIV